MSDGAATAPRVVLASQSPRRRDLLSLVGIPHEVRPADVDESVRPGEGPEPYTERLAREKAAVVAAQLPVDDDAVVVAADTTVVLDGEILGKPVDAAEARHMVRRLAGRTHEVYTGLAVMHDGHAVAAVERVEVTFRELSDEEIDAYVATGEPLDKAGAYGIQGYGATIVERIDGDYFAVMGLSLVRLVALFRALGLTYRFAGVSRAAR